jgi:UDP-glucose 4-epimerase
MKAIVIGATGSTGMSLVDYLDERNWMIYATGQRERVGAFEGKKNVHYVALDISKRDDFKKLPTKDIDCVVLLAGAMPARMEGYDPQKYIDVNVTGALNVAEFCRQNGIGKIVFAQSHSDVFGHWNTGEYIKHDAPRSLNLKGDHAMYIISKCAAVDILEHYYQEYGIKNVILRLPTIYCNWPESTFYVNGVKTDMAYMYFINRARRGEEIEIWGDPTKAKDIVYVKDFDQIVEKAMSSGVARGFYNVGSGIPTTLEEQIAGIVDVFSPTGRRSPVRYVPTKPSQASYLYDISRTERDLGYEVRYPYLKMLNDMKAEIEA